MGSTGVSQNRTLPDKEFAATMQDQRGLLICLLDRHETHVGALHRFADRLAIGSTCWVLTYGRTYCGGISRTSWPKRRSSRGPVMPAPTRLDPNKAGREHHEEPDHLGSPKPLPQHRLSGIIDT